MNTEKRLLMVITGRQKPTTDKPLFMAATEMKLITEALNCPTGQ